MKGRMPSLNIVLNGDDAWPDLKEKDLKGDLLWLKEDFAVTCLSGGMTSGRPSVAIRIDLPDGRTVVQETSLRLFLMAADAFRAKYGEQLGDA